MSWNQIMLGKLPRHWGQPWPGVLADPCQVKPPAPQRRGSSRGGLSQNQLLEQPQLGFRFLQKTAGGRGSRVTSHFSSPKDLSQRTKESYPESTRQMPNSL